jgi:outer membrane protein
MKWIMMVVILFGTGIGVSDSFSQEKTVDTILTLEECIQIALKNRPELQMANLDILNAELQIKEATSYYYPRVNVTAGYTRFNKPLTLDVDIDVSALTKQANIILGGFGVTLPSVLHQQFEVGKTDWWAVSVDLTQPLYTFGRIKEGVRQAEIGHSLAVTQKEKKGKEIVSEVKKAYCQFLFTQELLHLLREAETKAGVVVKMVKIAYETAVPEKEEKGTTRIDYLKARNFHSEVKAKLGEVGKNASLAELYLKTAMGLDGAFPLRVIEVPLEAMQRFSRDSGEVKERTLERNLDLKSMDLGIKLFDSRRKSAGKEYLPKIGIQSQYIGPEDRFETKNFWYAGIAITMPIFDGFFTRAKVGQAEVQFQKVKGQKLLLEKALSLQVENLNSTLTELKERIQILQDAIKEAQERLQLTADGFAAGITEYEELLLAGKAELEMRSAYLQSLFLYQMTRAEIELISGVYEN